MIRLVIADDHPLVRSGVRHTLEPATDIRVVGEVGHFDEVAPLLEREAVDILLLDVSMPGPGFLPSLDALRAWPTVRVLVVSLHPEERYAVQALRHGAMGYLTKDRTGDELLVAVRRIVAGRRYVTASLADRLAAHLEEPVSGARHARLSRREFETLSLIAAGHSLKEIGAELGVSPKTVTTYRARLLRKLELHSTADLIRYALEHGITA